MRRRWPTSVIMVWNGRGRPAAVGDDFLEADRLFRPVGGPMRYPLTPIDGISADPL